MKLMFKKAVTTAYLCLFACLSCKNSSSTTKNAELRTYLQGEPLSLDPRIGGTRSCQVFLRQLFEGLTRIAQDGTPTLAAAESVDISPDGKTYTFHLKKNLWSNGEEVTANDFEYAWKSILSPNFPSNYSYAFHLIKGARDAKTGKLSLNDVGIKAIDDRTLVVELNHPAPYFLELTANPLYSPVCKRVVEAKPDWSKQAGNEYVSNGPFTLTSWKHQAEFTLTKNPFYRDKDAVNVDSIHVAIIDDPQRALGLFEKGEIDIVGEPFGPLPLEAITDLVKQNKLTTQQVGGLYWLEVNTAQPLLSSAKIRTALAAAINRDEITRHLLQGGEKPSFTILPETLTSLKKPTFQDNDQKTAILLFNEGLQELGLTKETMPPLTITCWSDAREKAIASAIQQQWSQTLSIPVAITTCDWNTFFKKVSDSDYQIAGASWYTWYQDPIYNLEFMKYKAGGLNGTGWESPQYAALLDASDMANNKESRALALAQAEEIIMQDMPIIPLFSQTYKYMNSSKVQGFYLTPVGQLELKGVSVQ
ncbi:MAG: peptide transporter substrate-binding protein [Chlamydiia bacterium]|nr:peptide transporter substrate-binding protein [Chlamydiia bacterium]